jgi:hypothetical protein
MSVSASGAGSGEPANWDDGCFPLIHEDEPRRYCLRYIGPLVDPMPEPYSLCGWRVNVFGRSPMDILELQKFPGMRNPEFVGGFLSEVNVNPIVLPDLHAKDARVPLVSNVHFTIEYAQERYGDEWQLWDTQPGKGGGIMVRHPWDKYFCRTFKEPLRHGSVLSVGDADGRYYGTDELERDLFDPKHSLLFRFEDSDLWECPQDSDPK